MLVVDRFVVRAAAARLESRRRTTRTTATGTDGVGMRTQPIRNRRDFLVPLVVMVVGSLSCLVWTAVATRACLGAECLSTGWANLGVWLLSLIGFFITGLVVGITSPIGRLGLLAIAFVLAAVALVLVPLAAIWTALAHVNWLWSIDSLGRLITYALPSLEEVAGVLVTIGAPVILGFGLGYVVREVAVGRRTSSSS